MGLQVNRLAFGLGAEVTGLDLSQHLSDADVAAIRKTWLENLVLVFPGQTLSMPAQVAFSARFGKLEIHPQKHYRHPEYPEIFEVSNRVINGKTSDSADAGRRWHSDGAFSLRPPTGSFLYCEKRPPVGGDTWFTNMYMAFDALSDTMKQVVSSLQVVNDLGSTIEMRLRDPMKVADHLKDNPPVVQPMVRVHPETGRKALYLGDKVKRFDGMTEAESKPLIDYLNKHATRFEFLYRHQWRANDIVAWDNRCTMHLALGDFDETQRRHMERTTVLGTPSGYIVEYA